MDADTYSNEEVVKYLNENFVNVKIDTDSNKDLAKKFEIQGIPATLFLDADGKEVLRIVGYDQGFLDQVKTLHEMGGIEKDLAAQPNDIPTAIRAGDALLKLGRNDRAKDVLARALELDKEAKAGKAVEILYKLGLAVGRIDGASAAQEFWGKALAIDPDNKTGFVDDINFESCALESKDEEYEAAAMHFKTFLEHFKDSDRVPEAMYLLGAAEVFTGAKEEALKVLKDLVAKFPGTTAAKNAEQALKYLEKQ